jgi:hypothetical protein
MNVIASDLCEAISCYEEIAHRTGARRKCRAEERRSRNDI